MTAGLGSYMEGLQYKAPAPMVYTAGAVLALPRLATLQAPLFMTLSHKPISPIQDYVAPVVAPVVASGGGYDGGGYDAAKGGRIRAYADGGSIPQGIASLGRGQDSMLVHMTPGEVHGLQRLAMAHGGSLTINPQTGLPEAGFLSSMLPTLIGLGVTAASGGTIPGWMIGAGVGGITALTSGS
jgi:hypothetical protein